jgi:hypothetical protein
MSADPLERYPDLGHLIGAYLNQDYVIYGPTLEAAVRAFMADDPPEHGAAVRADIVRFLHDNAHDVDAALDALDSDRAQPPDMSGRDYLLWLDGVLADPGATIPARPHAAE